MARLRIGINGMGRIGRTLLREMVGRPDCGEQGMEVVAVNNPGIPGPYLHLLRFDSVHGQMQQKLEYRQGKSSFQLDGRCIQFTNCKNPGDIPWGKNAVDVVIDATGKFKDRESLALHKRDSVKKVVLCAPGKGLDATFVMGINHHTYDPHSHHIISNASCTTNCLAPVAQVLHQQFGIERGFMTTVHAYTSDQSLLDRSHLDLRRARAAAMSMIPTTTGAAKAVGMVIPELLGKLDGFAIRVPTPNVSMVDLNVRLKKNASIEDINHQFVHAARESLKGILKTESLPLVSNDYIGMRESSCVDLELTNVIEDMAKVVAWYDNEVGFSNRIIDLVRFIMA